jgi:FixJ family two-component response regulator
VPHKPLLAIVDDDESVRDATLDLIRAMGFSATAFQSADEFLQSGRVQETSCLIADVRMPGMTGIELNDRLVGEGNVIPVILITAFPEDRDRDRAIQADVVCYLMKPFDERELLACIRAALRRRMMDGGKS